MLLLRYLFFWFGSIVLDGFSLIVVYQINLQASCCSLDQSLRCFLYSYNLHFLAEILKKIQECSCQPVAKSSQPTPHMHYHHTGRKKKSRRLQMIRDSCYDGNRTFQREQTGKGAKGIPHSSRHIRSQYTYTATIPIRPSARRNILQNWTSNSDSDSSQSAVLDARTSILFALNRRWRRYSLPRNRHPNRHPNRGKKDHSYH